MLTHNRLHKTHTSSATCMAMGSALRTPVNTGLYQRFHQQVYYSHSVLSLNDFNLKQIYFFFSLIWFSTLGCSSHTPDPPDQGAALAPCGQHTHTPHPLPKPWDTPGALGKDNSSGMYAESEVAQVA